ncbi:MAG: elongation factor P [Planctomycetes bacterium]|nr:elongation factor P [Planctomycetota bacterium]
MKVNEIKKGQIIVVDGDNWQVVAIDHVRPGKGPAYYQLGIKNLKRGNVLTRRFNTTESVELVYTELKTLQYLYADGDQHVFMDNETYEQFSLQEKLIGDDLPYIALNSDVKFMFTAQGTPLYIDMPASVVLQVTETEPGAKGDTVSNVQKPAKLETGLEIKVPLHVKVGDKVKVDTRNGTFIERA